MVFLLSVTPFKKQMDGRFFDVQRMIKSRKKIDSFVTRYEQHFKYTISCNNTHNYISSKVVKHINTIGSMKSFKNSIFSCIKGKTTKQNNVHDQNVTLMNKLLEIYEA